MEAPSSARSNVFPTATPRWVFTLLLCACLRGIAFAGAADERVLDNGKTLTGEPEHPYAEGVAIRGDKIVAVGNRGEVSKAVASGAEMIDLKGNFLLPGLIDSHCHAVDGGLSLISADGSATRFWDQPRSGGWPFETAARARPKGVPNIPTDGYAPSYLWARGFKV